MTEVRSEDRRNGVLFGLAAYGVWGLMPIYFGALKETSKAYEILSHRIAWSAILLVLLLTGLRRWPDFLCCLRSRRLVLLLTLSTILIAINWFAFIYGVATERVLQTSLGYFITPLVNVLLGMVFFRERLRRVQWVALTLAAGGIVYLVWYRREMPWIALSLAGSFGMYGLVRKKTPVDAVVGLSVETLLLFPLCVGAIVYWAVMGEGSFGQSARATSLLAVSGVATAIPLLCFGAAARRLPLTVLGFLQYIAPSISCLVGIFWFDEPFRDEMRISFALIWTALAIFSIESIWIAASVPRALEEPALAE